MAPIGPKLGQTPFQVIPDVSFFDAEIFFFLENKLFPASTNETNLKSDGEISFFGNFKRPFTPRT